MRQDVGPQRDIATVLTIRPFYNAVCDVVAL